MNPELTAARRSVGLHPDPAMNYLQGEAGAISDNCITIDDIAPCDVPAAVDALKKLLAGGTRPRVEPPP